MARFDRLDTLHKDHGTVEGKAELSGQRVQAAEQDVATAQADEAQATGEVGQDAETLRQQIRDWAEAAAVAVCPPQLVEDWCDQISELTVIDAEAGVACPGPSVVDTMRGHMSEMRRDIADRVGVLRVEHAPVAARRQEVDDELERVRARTDSPPAAPALWARRERPGLDDELGAPLWRLVNPVDGLDGELLARLEAAAAASGLLDAWVSADGMVDTVDGRLLADVQLESREGVRGEACGRSSSPMMPALSTRMSCEVFSPPSHGTTPRPWTITVTGWPRTAAGEWAV